MNILLGTQGTYPYYEGGVSAWCADLLTQLPQVNFTIYAIRGHSTERQIHALPANVQGISHISLWGVSDPDSYFRGDFSSADLRRRKKNTTTYDIQKYFLPAFRLILQAILRDESNPEALEKCGEALYELWIYFHNHNWLATWRHQLTWQSFADMMSQSHQQNMAKAEIQELLSTGGMTTAIRVMHHYLTPLLAPIPKADVYHSTAAGMIAMVGVIAKYAYGIPFILTEHGVMMREQYIFLSENRTFSLAVKQFLQKLLAFLCRLSYLYADIICPVANYNKRWEVRFGADPTKIRTIYNGIDAGRFVPNPKPPETAGRPTVTAATRIVPIKDIEMMIRAAAQVRDKIPNVLFQIFGSLTADPEYVERCRHLIAEFKLTDNFQLRGHHSKPQEIYNVGDICILSSISEAMPLTVLEAMSCERPVVSTDVGGIAEALGDCGILVRPRDATAFAEGIVKLLSDDDMRLQLGRKARERVLNFFQIQTWAQTHYELYDSYAKAGARVPLA